MKRLILIFILALFCCHEEVGVSEVTPPEVKPPEIQKPTVVSPELQGPRHRVDVFKQREAKVDILWVVDNSRSMLDEQDNLALNFEYFVAFMAETNVDFHIGIISTDMRNSQHQGKLQGSPSVITPETPQMAEVFSANIHVGTAGGAMEQGLEAMRAALSEPLLSTTNANFIRADASLFVIAVSDEDDASFGPTHYYERFLEGYKGGGNFPRVSFSAIIGDVPNGCETARPGIRYAELAQLTQGIVASICASDFSLTLEDLGFSAAGLIRIFPLSARPEPQAIDVWVENERIVQDELTGWKYDPEVNSIVFEGEYIPPSGSTIRVEYLIAQ